MRGLPISFAVFTYDKVFVKQKSIKKNLLLQLHPLRNRTILHQRLQKRRPLLSRMQRIHRQLLDLEYYEDYVKKTFLSITVLEGDESAHCKIVSRPGGY